MIPGPNEIFECPHCGQPVMRGSLASGNTFGAQLYSDGKQVAPMLPEFPAVAKCRTCHGFFWFSELKPVAEAEPWEKSATLKGKKIHTAAFLTLEELFEVLALVDPEDLTKVSDLRHRILWAYNDRTRKGEPRFTSATDEARFQDNARAMLAFLEPDDVNEGILSAELYRYLGEFDRCTETLEALMEPGLDEILDPILARARAGDREVFRLR